jgi:hypothetical protein
MIITDTKAEPRLETEGRPEIRKILKGVNPVQPGIHLISLDA